MGLFWIPDFNSEFNMRSPQPTMQEPCYFKNLNGSSRNSKTWDLLSKSAVKVKSYYEPERI
ncbi:MAG: hypothetical protein EBT88_06550 [Proteobacteria bacterium]|nr:hypothetical protein [Pseudomonadota bacterium]